MKTTNSTKAFQAARSVQVRAIVRGTDLRALHAALQARYDRVDPGSIGQAIALGRLAALQEAAVAAGHPTGCRHW